LQFVRINYKIIKYFPANKNNKLARAQPALHFREGNFHENSFDAVFVPIQPWYNFFANGHR